MSAVVNPKLFEYWQVKNASITDNIMVDCKEAINLGSGKNETRIVTPDLIKIINNYVIDPQNC